MERRGCIREKQEGKRGREREGEGEREREGKRVRGSASKA